jgi:hypothetical protein
MDEEMRWLEERKLARDRWHLLTSLAGPAAAVLIAWLTIGADLRAQTDLERRQFLADAGEAACPSASGEGPWADVYSRDFCVEWIGKEVPPMPAVQRELIEQLASHPEQRDEILDMWRVVYPGQRWLEEVAAASGG